MFEDELDEKDLLGAEFFNDNPESDSVINDDDDDEVILQQNEEILTSPRKLTLDTVDLV